MSIHQAKLLAGAPERALDAAALDAWREGERDLWSAIAADQEVLSGLRQQALALLEAAKWSRARDVAVGVVALGSVHAVDALIVAAASAELADARTAAAAEAHATRLLGSKGVRLAVEPKIATLRALLERVPADACAEAKSEWEQQRRLCSAIKSFECFTAHLARGADAPARVEAALSAAGACAATNAFPRQALAQASRSIRGARRSESAPPVSGDPLTRLAEEKVAAAVRAAGGRARDRARFDRALGSLLACLEQALCAPSYCVTRMGWHYPHDREGYRARRFEPEVALLSELRWDASWAAAQAALQKAAAAEHPEEALERALVERFFAEIGFDRRRAPELRVDTAAIAAAVKAELVIPLRALDETIQDMDPSGIGTREDVRRRVDALVIAIVEGRDAGAALWATKAGDPALGFDVAGHEVLRERRD